MGNDRLAFIGDTVSAKGEKVPELFIVDLPKDEQGWKRAGDAPLQERLIQCPRRLRA